MFGLLEGQIVYILKSNGSKDDVGKEFDLENWLLRQENARKKFQNDDLKKNSNKNTDYAIQNIQSYFKLDRTYNQSDLVREAQFFPLLPPDLQDEV